MSPPKRPTDEAAPDDAPAAPPAAVPDQVPVGVGIDDQRQFPRRALELPASVRDAGNRVDGAIHFDTRDISLGGAFLRSDLLFEVGEELQVAFELPDAGVVRVTARVVRVARGGAGAREPAGMGIAFVDLAARDRDAVRALLERG